MLTDDQIARMQATAEASMPDTVKILRDTKVYDGGGGYHTEYVELATVSCTIGLPLGGESDERNKSRAQVQDDLLHTIRMPAETDVQATDRIEAIGGDLDGSIWEVNGVMKRGKWEIARDVKVVSL